MKIGRILTSRNCDCWSEFHFNRLMSILCSWELLCPTGLLGRSYQQFPMLATCCCLLVWLFKDEEVELLIRNWLQLGFLG